MKLHGHLIEAYVDGIIVGMNSKKLCRNFENCRLLHLAVKHIKDGYERSTTRGTDFGKASCNKRSEEPNVYRD